MSRFTSKRLTALVLYGLFMSPLSAFEIDGSKWPGGSTDFYISIDGVSATGVLWNTAFVAALNEWNEKTDFHFNLIDEALNPCGFDILNGVDFGDDVCGTEFGANTLAVTLRRFSTEILGPARIAESDIVINTSVDFDVFDGPLFQFGQQFNGVDFQRVALHELGHALGLDHEEQEAAIMAPNIGDIDRLQEDDIAGVNALYGGLSNCAIGSLEFGITKDSLTAGDCIVSELTVGGGDTSFVDLFRFELDQAATVEFEMTSDTLDSVLILASSSLEFLDFDDKSSGRCESNLSANLQAGSYLLLTNTFDVPIKAECGNLGEYELKASLETSQLQSLGLPQSLLGTVNNAQFSGGITADNGTSFRNIFDPSQSLDINAEIQIDPSHRGRLGFLVVVAVIDNQLLFLDSSGNFVSSPGNALITSSTKVLQSTESIQIATDLVPRDLGIEEIEVDFIVGYGQTSNPNEVYYHQQPINLLVTP